MKKWVKITLASLLGLSSGIFSLYQYGKYYEREKKEKFILDLESKDLHFKKYRKIYGYEPDKKREIDSLVTFHQREEGIILPYIGLTQLTFFIKNPKERDYEALLDYFRTKCRDNICSEDTETDKRIENPDNLFTTYTDKKRLRVYNVVFIKKIFTIDNEATANIIIQGTKTEPSKYDLKNLLDDVKHKLDVPLSSEAEEIYKKL